MLLGTKKAILRYRYKEMITNYGKKQDYDLDISCEKHAIKQRRRLAGRERNHDASYIPESYNADILDAYNEFKNNNEW